MLYPFPQLSFPRPFDSVARLPVGLDRLVVWGTGLVVDADADAVVGAAAVLAVVPP